MNALSRPDIVVDIIAVILGIAYPLVTETISKLDEKFSTSIIGSFFHEEYSFRLYRGSLLIDIILLFTFLILERTEIITSDYFIKLINFVLVILTTVLVLSFLILINTLSTYYNREKLIKHIIKLDQKAQKKGNYKYFIALTDIFCWSIRNEIDRIPETLNEYFYTCFRNYD